MFDVRRSRPNPLLFLALLPLVLLCATPLRAATAENPYQGIVERNVFGLKPPPPPPDPESLKPPPQKITLTGIMTIFGKKQALMKTPPGPAAPPKPGEPPKPPLEHSYMLTEGQMEDGITVLQIDEKAQLVKVDNSGTVQMLSFTNDALKTASAGAPGIPGGLPAAGFRGANPMAPAGFGGGTKSIPMPGRPLRLPSGMSGSSSTGVGGDSTGMAGANQPAPGTMAALAQAAQGTGAATPPATDPQQTVISRSVEENVLLYEATRLKNQRLIDSGVRLPAMPPHPFTAGLDAGSAQPSTPAPQAAPQPPSRPGMPQLPQ